MSGTTTSLGLLPTSEQPAATDTIPLSEGTNPTVTRKATLSSAVGVVAPLLVNNLADLADPASALVNLGGATAEQAAAAAPVQAVFGRTGQVALEVSDLTAALGFPLVSLTSASVSAGNLLIYTTSGTVNAGSVIGPTGPSGPASAVGTPKGTWNANTGVTNGGGTLSSGGTGGVAGDTYTVATAGTLSIDGNGTWNAGDWIVNSGGTIWLRVTNPGPSGVLSSITLPNSMIADDGLANGQIAIGDTYGNAVAVFSSAGAALGSVTTPSLTATGTVAGAAGSFTSVTATTATAPTIVTNTTTLSDDGTNTGDVAYLDAYGNAHHTISAAGAHAFGTVSTAMQTVGTLVVTGSATLPAVSSTTFSDAELRAFDATNRARSLLLKTQVNTVIAQAVWNYSMVVGYGQSLSVGATAWPAISTTQPFNSVMLGQSTRGVNYSLTSYITWAPYGPATLQPLVAVNQATTANTIQTHAQLAALTEGGACAGEVFEVGATNAFCGLTLRWRGLLTDPAHILMAGSCGEGGQPIANLLSGASPNIYGRIPSLIGQYQTAALAVGSSFGVCAFIYSQGENDTNTSFSSYLAAHNTLRASVSATVESVTGQTSPPGFFFYQVGGLGLSTYDDQNNLGTPMAQLTVAHQQYASGAYCIGSDYWVNDNSVSVNGPHLTGNGERWVAEQYAKVMHLTINLRQSWLPTSPWILDTDGKACIWRGSQIVLNCHVPEPPLVFDSPWVGNAQPSIPTDKGFLVLDGQNAAITTGAVQTITGVTIPYGTVILIQLAAPPPSGPPTVCYGDATYHSGNGFVRDSDSTVSFADYFYDSSFSNQTSQNTSQVGKPYPLWNPMSIFYMNATAG